MDISETDILHKYDSQNMLKRLREFPNEFAQAFNKVKCIETDSSYVDFRNVLFLGMGGSGIPGDYILNLFSDDILVPTVVHKGYGIPAYVDDSTLVFVTSYSGTTEETTHSYIEARNRGARIFGIASSNQLLERFREDGVPHYIPPTGRTTREAFAHLLAPMIEKLHIFGLIKDQTPAVEDAVSVLHELSSAFSPENRGSDNHAKSLARSLDSRVPVFFGTLDLTDVVALRWKHQWNENAKTLAFFEELPDAAHNQLAALESDFTPRETVTPVFLRSTLEPSPLTRRIEALISVLEHAGFSPYTCWAKGEGRLAQLLSQTYLGDYASYYAAILRQVDPTVTRGMSKLKEALGLRDITPVK